MTRSTGGDAPAGQGVPLPEQLRRHAAYCDGTGAPLYGELLRGFADDVEAGGVVAQLLAPWADAPQGHAAQLRLLAALHRVVLRREAPVLATHYRSVGGTAAPQGVWPVARAVLEERREELRAELDVPPQTNEPGRAAALVVAVLHACARHGRRRVRLLELGASAGLNLRVAAFRVTGDGFAWGPAGSSVDLTGAVVGGPPARLLDVARRGVDVVEARGCDLTPVDAGTTEGRLRLTSFVWPDHVDRFERLRGALAVAARHPVVVDAADAGEWLAARLAEPTDDDVVTVVWHSVVRQYLSSPTWQAVQSALAAATAPTAHAALDAPTRPDEGGFVLTVDGVVVARAAAHGVPVTLV